MTVYSFGVERANNTRREAVWKSDYDAIAAELESTQRQARMSEESFIARSNQFVSATHAYPVSTHDH